MSKDSKKSGKAKKGDASAVEIVAPCVAACAAEIATITPRILITCDKDKQVANVSVTRGIDDYTGEYTREDAGLHEGDVINQRNFLAYIAAATAPGSAGVSLVFSSDEKAVITIAFEAEFAHEKFVDSIIIVCVKVSVEPGDKKLREIRLECLHLREEILELRRGCEEVEAIAVFCARWKWQVPFDGRDFYLALIRRIIRSDPVVLPIVGCDFIRVGERFFACDCLGIKMHNIVCCTEPQNHARKLDVIGATAFKEATGHPDPVAFAHFHWMCRARSAAYFIQVNTMINATSKSMALIGAAHVPARPRYWAFMTEKSPSGSRAREIQTSMPAYVEFKGDAVTYFGIALSSEFAMFYDGKNERANTREPITREFEASVAATADFEKLAISSGLPEYAMKAKVDYLNQCEFPTHP
jgi:hypothetical protein